MKFASSAWILEGCEILMKGFYQAYKNNYEFLNKTWSEVIYDDNFILQLDSTSNHEPFFITNRLIMVGVSCRNDPNISGDNPYTYVYSYISVMLICHILGSMSFQRILYIAVRCTQICCIAFQVYSVFTDSYLEIRQENYSQCHKKYKNNACLISTD